MDKNTGAMTEEVVTVAEIEEGDTFHYPERGTFTVSAVYVSGTGEHRVWGTWNATGNQGCVRFDRPDRQVCRVVPMDERRAAEIVASGDYVRDARLVSPDGTRHLTVIETGSPTTADPRWTFRARCECGWEAGNTYAAHGGMALRCAEEDADRDADAHAAAVIAAGAVLLAEWTARQDAERR